MSKEQELKEVEQKIAKVEYRIRWLQSLPGGHRRAYLEDEDDPVLREYEYLKELRERREKLLEELRK